MYLEDVDVYFYERFYADEYARTLPFFLIYLLWLSLVLCILRSLQPIHFFVFVYALYFFSLS